MHAVPLVLRNGKTVISGARSRSVIAAIAVGEDAPLVIASLLTQHMILVHNFHVLLVVVLRFVDLAESAGWSKCVKTSTSLALYEALESLVAVFEALDLFLPPDVVESRHLCVVVRDR